MIPYTLGLDIGISSVGWAVLRNTPDGEPNRIEDLGVRIFDSAEHPKTGASLALPRREARSSRRRIRRRRHRKERIKNLLEQSGVMSKTNMNDLFSLTNYEKDVYTLRAEGLERCLQRAEWVRVLIHLAQRRGYRSNSTAEAGKEKDSGVLKIALSQNAQLMSEKGYRTVGEMFCRDEKFLMVHPDGSVWRKTRNSSGEYHFTVTREMIEQEVQMLFSCQRNYGNPFAHKELESSYTAILFSQRNFDEGPGGSSPYRKSDLRGLCTFEKETGELRAFKACYTFEYFKLLQDLNHIRILSSEPSRGLTSEERKQLIALSQKSENLHYWRLRKELSLPEDARFNTVRYGEEDYETREKKTKFPALQAYHKMRKALDAVWKNQITEFSQEQLDEIATVLSLYKSDHKRREQLSALGIAEASIEALLPLSFSKAGHLSLTAMKKLIPYLEMGMNYDAACSVVYGDHHGHRNTIRSARISFDLLQKEGKLDGITNPVVLRAISQTFKVVNAIIRKYGSPQRIHIELAREMSRNFDDRKKIQKKYEDHQALNERYMTQIQSIKGGRPTGQDLVKYKLFQEQKETCLYSGQKLDPTRLFEPGYVDVDHIIPYSISFDDSYSNKVLVLSAENRQKGNRLPLEYMAASPEKAERFITLVETCIRDHRKRQKLLKKAFSEEERQGFKARNLVDTQYISSTIHHLLNDYLEFAPSVHKKKVVALNGAVTAYMRKRFGLQKIREEGDLHHAMDAVVIAVTTDRMIQRISNYSKRREWGRKVMGQYVDPETGELLTRNAFDAKYAPEFPLPWPWFRKELEARLSPDPWSEIEELHLPGYGSEEKIKPVFVSRMPKRKVSGAAHKDTIRSSKMPGHSVIKTALADLKLDKDGEIENYYDPNSDRLLYDALKARLRQYDGKAKEAFAAPFYKPKKDGTPGPLVQKVKIYSKTNLNVSVNGGIADNGGMVRIDVFHIEDDGYYFVPIYTSDVVKKVLPNRAVVASTPFERWKPMEDKDFIFSLYPGDLILVEHRKTLKLTAASKQPTGERELIRKEALLYYSGADISTGAISLTTHDRKYTMRGLGIKTLCSIRKFEVDVLGEYHEVHIPEVRQAFR